VLKGMGADGHDFLNSAISPEAIDAMDELLAFMTVHPDPEPVTPPQLSTEKNHLKRARSPEPDPLEELDAMLQGLEAEFKAECAFKRRKAMHEETKTLERAHKPVREIDTKATECVGYVHHDVSIRARNPQ